MTPSPSDSPSEVLWEPFLAHVRVNAPAAERAGQPLPGLFPALAATGFLRDRWRDGRRAGLRSALALIEAVAPIDGGTALAVSLHSEVVLATLARHSSNPDAQQVFTAGLDGAAIGAFALTEDDGGSNPAAVSSRAERRADGTWHLSGHKRYVSNLEGATHCLMLCDACDDTHRGPTLFLVDLTLRDVARVGAYEKLGTRTVDAGRLEFDVVVSASARIGPVGSGLPLVFRALRYERLAVSCAVIAGARHALALSTAFLRLRHHPRRHEERLFDRSALSHLVALAWVDLEAATALIERTVARDIAGRATDADYAATKHRAATTATTVADTALQLMGGRGYTASFPHERIWRDARLGRIGAGTDQMMLEVVARHLDKPITTDRVLADLMSADQPEGES